MKKYSSTDWGEMFECEDGDYVKAEVADKLLEALREMISITKIAHAEYCENFAWAELAYAEEVLNYSKEN